MIMMMILLMIILHNNANDKHDDDNNIDNINNHDICKINTDTDNTHKS